jgi:hypothetical protein
MSVSTWRQWWSSTGGLPQIPSGSRATKHSSKSLPLASFAHLRCILPSACCRASDWQEAIKRYTASIEMFPTAEAYGNRAAALIRQGRWQEAAADCTQALAHNPRFVKAYIRRSRCHAELGNHAGALQVPPPPSTLHLLPFCRIPCPKQPVPPHSLHGVTLVFLLEHIRVYTHAGTAPTRGAHQSTCHCYLLSCQLLGCALYSACFPASAHLLSAAARRMRMPACGCPPIRKGGRSCSSCRVLR